MTEKIELFNGDRLPDTVRLCIGLPAWRSFVFLRSASGVSSELEKFSQLGLCGCCHSGRDHA